MYAIIILKKGIKKGKLIGEGNFISYAISEFIVYFFGAMGFPDFLLNMPIFKKFKWVEDKYIPDTLMSTSIVPGAVIAFLYLVNSSNPDMKTLIPCLIAIVVGSYVGAGFLLKVDGKRMNDIMLLALSFSMIALVARLIVSNGDIGISETLPISKILIAVPLIFSFGFMNPFGVPMKPPSSALFLLLGLSPKTTLTNMLVLGSGSTISSCFKIIKAERYNKKLSIASVIFGTIGGVVGYMFMINISQTVLTIILLLIILIAIVQNIKKREK